MKKGSLDGITTLGVFLFVVLLMVFFGIFVALVVGIKGAADSESGVVLSVDEIDSRVLVELYLRESIEIDNEDLVVEDIIRGLLHLDDSKLVAERSSLLEEVWAETYGCDGKNELSILSAEFLGDERINPETYVFDSDGIVRDGVYSQVIYPSSSIPAVNSNRNIIVGVDGRFEC